MSQGTGLCQNQSFSFSGAVVSPVEGVKWGGGHVRFIDCGREKMKSLKILCLIGL